MLRSHLRLGKGKNMSASDYYRYKSAIQTANDSNDVEALKQIQKQLIARYGLEDGDVQTLLKLFRYTV